MKWITLKCQEILYFHTVIEIHIYGDFGHENIHSQAFVFLVYFDSIVEARGEAHFSSATYLNSLLNVLKTE